MRIAFKTYSQHSSQALGSLSPGETTPTEGGSVLRVAETSPVLWVIQYKARATHSDGPSLLPHQYCVKLTMKARVLEASLGSLCGCTQKVHAEGESQVMGWKRSTNPAEMNLMEQKMCPQRELDSSVLS